MRCLTPAAEERLDDAERLEDLERARMNDRRAIPVERVGLASMTSARRRRGAESSAARSRPVGPAPTTRTSVSVFASMGHRH